MMEIRDNEPTGVIRKAGENQGRLVHKGYVSMEMEREITVIREGSVVAGSFIIEATIRVADPNKTFRAWRDSDRRPYSGDAADGKIIRLIEAEYQQAIVGFEPWDLKNILDQEKISRANEDIEAELEKNGLVIEVMNVKLFTEMFLGGIDNR